MVTAPLVMAELTLELLKFMAVRSQQKAAMDKETQYLAHRAKALIKELAKINYELAQMVVAGDNDKTLPDWFMIEIVRDIPRLIELENKKNGKTA